MIRSILVMLGVLAVSGGASPVQTAPTSSFMPDLKGLTDLQSWATAPGIGDMPAPAVMADTISENVYGCSEDDTVPSLMVCPLQTPHDRFGGDIATPVPASAHVEFRIMQHNVTLVPTPQQVKAGGLPHAVCDWRQDYRHGPSVVGINESCVINGTRYYLTYELTYLGTPI